MASMTRGRLRIYLGAAPGVGKTVAMLAEGARRAARGTDVVIGLVETHGRPFTEQQTAGLEVVPRRRACHSGATLEEMDLDAVLRRRPEVALVDELAHTNIPGSRHEKRWQDIEELLEAGIDVISTVNIQHLESLNDVVGTITGIVQRETVPDRVVRRADQIDLVDMSPEALRRRMAHGNIYRADKVDAALANYFRMGNLSALRELALLWLADRVDEGLTGYRSAHGIQTSWPTRERVVVALSGGPEGDALLRRGARIASRGGGGELLAVFVTRSDGLTGATMPDIARLRRLTEELEGTFHSVTGPDAAEAILQFARAANASQIVIGTSSRPLWQRFFLRGVSDSVIAGSKEIDVHVVNHPATRTAFRALTRQGLPRRRFWFGHALALALPGLTTLLLELFNRPIGLALITPIYLLLTVVVALVGGVWPAVVSAVVGSLAVNWFFTPPVHTFTVTSPANVAALVISVVVALLVATLVHRNAQRMAAAVAAQNEATAMADLTNVLLGSTDQLNLLLDRAVEMFSLTGAAVVADAGVVGATTGFNADAGGDRVPVDDGHELILQPGGLPAAHRRLIAAYAAHASAILQRRALQASAAEIDQLARDNRARTALLSAVSHDLRTPLAGIKAAIGSLRDDTVTFDPADEEELKEAIETSADRLDALIGDLLDMSRLQTGALVARPQLHDLGELIPEFVRTLSDPQRVAWEVEPDARAAVVDPGLFARVLGNLTENALRHQPDEAVRITAARIADTVEVRVIDTGPGVSLADREVIFEPFQRRGDAPAGAGIGLGLAVARGLAEAMGGTVVAEDTPGGGLTMVVTLPTRSGQIIPPTVEEDAE